MKADAEKEEKEKKDVRNGQIRDLKKSNKTARNKIKELNLLIEQAFQKINIEKRIT